MNNRLNSGPRTPCSLVNRLALLALLSACSGGGEQSQTDPVPAVPAQAPASVDPCDSMQAIEGGGRAKLAGVVTKVGSDGYVSVGDIRFNADDADVYFDGEAASLASLRIGDVVGVTGPADAQAQAGCATSITADALIVAAIESVDTTPRSGAALGTLKLLGQEVRIGASTEFGVDLESTGIAALQPGDIIRLSGLYEDVGVIVATRIDRAVGGYTVTGVVTRLDSLQKTFRVNDSIVVAYGEAGIIDLPTGAPRNGDPVRVTGTSIGVDTETAEPQVVLRPDYVWHNRYGTTFTVFPDRHVIPRGGMGRFVASSGPGTVTWSIARYDGSACTPDLCGSIRPETGEYNASIFGHEAAFWVTATSIPDPTDRVTVPLYIMSSGGALTTGSNTVEGDVFASETGAIPYGEVGLWVRTDDRAVTWYNIWPDEHGQFVARHLPDSTVHFTSVKAGFVQPCAVRAYVNGDVRVRLEMMSISSLDAVDAPRPQLSVEPSLSGTIYELTPDGWQPVSGVEIGVHLDMWDNVIAYTVSNDSGNYYLCNLGMPVGISFFKRGYVQRQYLQFDTSHARVLDVEFVRE